MVVSGKWKEITFPWFVSGQGGTGVLGLGPESGWGVQSAPICWNVTARQWTSLGVVVGMLSSWITALLFVLLLLDMFPIPMEALKQIGVCDQILYSKQGMSTLLWAGIITSGISYFLCATFWYGLKKENVCIITLMIIVIGLVILTVISNLFVVINDMVRIAYGVSLGIHIFFLFCSIKFRQEIVAARSNNNNYGPYRPRNAV